MSERRRPVVVETGEWGVCAREASLRERIAAKLHAHRLDHQLASGRSPESFPLLSLRAQALARPANRRSLAASIRKLLRQSSQTPVHPLAAPLADLASVRSLHDELEDLAEHLDAPVPVSARGVALVQELMEDGASPLYLPQSREALRRRVQLALAALDPEIDWPQTA